MIPLNPKHLKILAAVLISLLAIRVVFFSRRADFAPAAIRHNQVLGEWGAREAATLVEGQGRVLLVSRQTSDELLRTREKAFEDTLRALGLDLAGILRIEDHEFHPIQGWSASFHSRVANELADADVVVSFVYTPPIGVVTGRVPRKINGRFVAVLPSSGTLHDYLLAGVVDHAIVSLPNPTPLSDTRVASEVWFNAFYQVLTRRDALSPHDEQERDVFRDHTYGEQVDLSDRM